MLTKKTVLSTLLACIIGFAGFAQAEQKFIKTTDGTEFKFDNPKGFGDTKKKDNVKTKAEIEFLKTGKNIYVGDAEAEKRGKKRFGYWSCTQCHGPTAKGQVGPGLVGPTFKYPKNATNKGMIETIWFGTDGGMGGKGYGVMAADDGMTLDELLKTIAWVRTNGSSGLTGNENVK
ncbi:c-type cytochrome [Methylophilaceae bacterium]|nr:c-type cytochrome [Methylophilaceae bacterium]|tara:strand:- start:113 stop:637 length:525 start_codon:yes stop_codon:yes gene_type:complete